MVGTLPGSGSSLPPAFLIGAGFSLKASSKAEKSISLIILSSLVVYQNVSLVSLGLRTASCRVGSRYVVLWAGFTVLVSNPPIGGGGGGPEPRGPRPGGAGGGGGAPGLNPPPPPPIGGFDTRTVKPAHKTTYRLPTLQLAVLKPNDTKDTFWYTTNDDKIIKEIDFSAFEEAFKLNPAPIKKAGGRDEPDPGKVPTIKTPQLKSLMEHTRLKNVAICKRRLPPMPLDDIMTAVNALDNSTISLDAIELLQRIEPNADALDKGGATSSQAGDNVVHVDLL